MPLTAAKWRNKMAKRQTRSEARKAAFTQIFQLGQQGENKGEMMEMLLAAMPECEDNLGYIQAAVNGVDEKKDILDEIIASHLKKGWTIHRISKASHAILLLALYEMKYIDDVPEKVAINEAVNLAKEYGTDDDAKFVNGILGSIVKADDLSGI